MQTDYQLKLISIICFLMLSSCGGAKNDGAPSPSPNPSSLSSISLASVSNSSLQSTSTSSLSNQSSLSSTSQSSMTSSSVSTSKSTSSAVNLSSVTPSSQTSSSVRSSSSTSTSQTVSSSSISSKSVSSSLGSSVGSSRSSASQSSAATSQSSTIGCGTTSPVGQVNGIAVLDGTGRTRSFDIVVSPNYINDRITPLVFDFHGAGGTSGGAANDGFQNAIAASGDAAIAVFPQGINWQGFGVGWDEACDGYDMIFFDNMIKYLSEHYCVNTKRIFVSGFSWGGDMTNALACCRGNAIKSIAPISGPERNNASCPTTQWPTTWMRYGLSDTAYTQKQFTDTRDFYKTKLTCSSTTTPLSGDSECVSYTQCSSPLTVCARPLGHQGLGIMEVEQLWQYWRALP